MDRHGDKIPKRVGVAGSNQTGGKLINLPSLWSNTKTTTLSTLCITGELE